jgi:rod shape determining protein RodA
MIVGVVAFVLATVIDYRALVRLAWGGLATAILLLVVVRLLGDAAHGKGSYRWLNVFGMGIQPSELAKVMVILALARMFQDGDLARYSLEQLAIRIVAIVVPIGLIAIQPDLGTAVLLGLVALSVGFLALPSVWPMVHVTLGALLCVPILWETMHDYQKNRVLAFLDPSADPTGNGWHTRQSIFAAGSGKIWGKGYGEGTQKPYTSEPPAVSWPRLSCVPRSGNSPGPRQPARERCSSRPTE